MTDHPINPPDELLDQWCITGKSGNLHNALTLAYRAGADQELEACCELVPGLTNYLRAARRPKPPSLKEQALAKLPEHPESMASYLSLSPGSVATIRRALEQL